MIVVDTIIVGQGLAGSILAYKLIKLGKSVVVFNDDSKKNASEIAIGLTNPITGKRLVKSWLIDQLLETSIPFYQQLELESGLNLIVDTKISRAIPNKDIFEQWQPNFLQAVEEGFIDKEVKTFSYNNSSFPYFDILKGYWLQTKPLLEFLKNFIKENGVYRNQKLEYNSILINKDFIQVDEILAKKIIFCDGAQAAKNPFTEHLPFNLNKGEVIRTNTLDGYDFDKILKKNIFIVPDGNTFRVGATYDRNYETEEPTEKAVHYFKQKLVEIGIEKFELLEHDAAVRPATIDRRPLIGELEENMYIFNGFGAKGVSLAPYFADHFIDYLFHDGELMSEVDVKRGSKN